MLTWIEHGIRLDVRNTRQLAKEPTNICVNAEDHVVSPSCEFDFIIWIKAGEADRVCGCGTLMSYVLKDDIRIPPDAGIMEAQV